ncbi:MAG TPA: OmpA family protein [Gemmatimonadales bacterium]|nr:OmpA family protein [Gemmatimonadales bacterium]
MSSEPWRAGAGYDPAAEELAELRELLLGADRRRIRELERRLDAAGVTGEELAELLPEAIALRARRDRQLARALAPTIEGAISESVRRNPREIATAIFPVLGPAIRKAIAEAFAGFAASINRAIEHSISPRGLAWRLESWRTGVPYPQIVLRHALIYRVEQVFLIHTETGLLLAQAAPADRPVTDADLVSGMLTAIRDFVGDAFGREQDAGGLRTFCVGELTVFVEQGPAAVLAAAVRGQAPEELHPRLQETLETIHLQFAGPLGEFHGDSEPFGPTVPLLEECLETRLATDRGERSRRRPAWIPWAVAAVLIAAVVGWRMYRSAREWNGALARLRAEPGIVVVDAERDWGQWRISGLRDPLAPEPAALLASVGVDTARVSGRWEPYLSGDPKFVNARSSPASARLSIERAIRRERVLFSVGSSGLDESAVIGHVSTEFRRLEALATAINGRAILTLVGRSDPTGSDAGNAALSRLRVEAARSALLERGVEASAIETRALGATSPLAAADPVERSTINRSVSFEVRVE